MVPLSLSKRRFERKPPLLLLLLFASAWTAFQCIPLPDALVSTLSPTLSAIRDDGVRLVGVGTSSTLSMDVGSSVRVLAGLLALSAIAYVALRLSVSERGRYALLASVAGLAILAALVSGIHKLFDAHSLYGIYTPLQSSTPIMGPLLNPNHLGCLTAVGTVISASLIFYQKQTSTRRAIWILGACACLAVTTATLSRGAVIALAIGIFVMLASLFLQKASQAAGDESRRERFLATTLPIGVIIVCSLGVSVYLGAGSVVQQLENTSFREVNSPHSKFAAWRSSAELVKESPVVGVGRGAFEAVFPRVHPGSAFTIFSHPENELVEFVVEWGVPATIVLALLAGWILAISLRRWRDGPLAAGALGAIAAVGFQSNFDFGIELLGIAAPIVVVVATLSYVPLTEMPSRYLRRHRVLRALHMALVLLGALVLLTSFTTTLEEDRLALHANPSPEQIHADIERHPMDYFGYSVLAEQMVRSNAPDSVNVLNHALRLHPNHSGLHIIAARLLVRLGRIDQAASEYATALRDTWTQRPIIEEALKALPQNKAADALPLELEVDPTLRILKEAKHPDVELAWLKQVVGYAPRLDAVQALYSVSVEQHDLVDAEQAGRTWCRLLLSPQCQLALARILGLESKSLDVIATLRDVDQWHGLQQDQIDAWILVCDAHEQLNHVDDARKCLDRLEMSGLSVSPREIEVRRARLFPGPANHL